MAIPREILERAGRRSGPAGTADTARGRRLLVVAPILCLALIGLFAASYALGGSLLRPELFGADVAAYRDAAGRLLGGQDLYAYTDPQATDVYRYAPWFAALWIPLTLLPEALVTTIWTLAQLAVMASLLWPLRRSWATAALAMLVAPLLLDYSWRGNVEASMLGIMALHRTRSGPVWLGLAASLKVMPLMLVADYIARREWQRAGVAVVVAAVLWLPALALGFGSYPMAPTTMSPWSIHPLVGLGVALAAIGATGWLALRRSRYTLLAATTTAVIASPRLLMLNAGYFLVPAQPHPRI